MSVKPGTHLGGIRSVEDVRLRCYCDADTGCWHLRSARGRPMPKGTIHQFHAYGVGKVSATRYVWELSKGRPMPEGKHATRTCESYDCVNPGHLRAMTRKEQGALFMKNGKSKSEAKSIAARLTAQSRSRITRELRAWITESQQSGPEVAHALGAATTHINTIRKRAREQFVNAMQWRQAA